MLLVEQSLSDPQILYVRFNYSLYYVNKMHLIDGAWFDRGTKQWQIPLRSLKAFESQFPGEIVYRTPRWVILKERSPDYSAMYVVSPHVLPSLNVSLYDYQAFGVRFMIDRLTRYGFVIMADDVGLGKTIQAIATDAWLRANKGAKKTLIICKKSIRTQWKTEGFERFTQTKAVVVSGIGAKRHKIYDAFAKETEGVLIMNYHSAWKDMEYVEKLGIRFDNVIIDEVHVIKNREGTLNNAAKELCKNIPYVSFLTGTPVISKPDDLFGIFQIADPKFFGSWKSFAKRYLFYENQGRFMKLVGFKHLDELRDKVQDVIIRRTEYEVTLSLPATVSSLIHADMDATQRTLLEKIREDRQESVDKLVTMENTPNKTPEILDEMESLDGLIKGYSAAEQAVADDPRLFRLSKSKMMVHRYAPMVPKGYVMSGKTEALLEKIGDIVDADKKVIVFTKFERATRMIKEDILAAIPGIHVAEYSGAISDDERDAFIQQFKTDDDCRVLVATDAAAEGLNLQCANHVISYDLPDTPSTLVQRNGRARRIGSVHSTVYTYSMITNESKDVDRLENLAKIDGLIDGVININKAQSVALKKAMGQ